MQFSTSDKRRRSNVLKSLFLTSSVQEKRVCRFHCQVHADMSACERIHKICVEYMEEPSQMFKQQLLQRHITCCRFWSACAYRLYERKKKHHILQQKIKFVGTTLKNRAIGLPRPFSCRDACRQCCNTSISQLTIPVMDVLL